MAKTRQIFSYCDYGKQYKVIKQLNTFDRPYKIYHCYRDFDGRHDYPTSHKKLVAQFDSMWEVFGWFRDNVSL